MVVILAGILIAAVVIAYRLPDDVTSVHRHLLAGALGRVNPVDFSFNLRQPLHLLVGYQRRPSSWRSRTSAPTSPRCKATRRPLHGREHGWGLPFNGIPKIPMQFLILFIGVLVFAFYLFERPPVFFNGPR
ncbi:MAG: hypothetical protein R3F43_21435 [bacterium]